MDGVPTVLVSPESLSARGPAAPDLDSLADSLVAGQLSPRTRKAYASDLAELMGALELWNLGLGDVTRDHLHLYRRWLTGESIPGLPDHPKCAPATVSRKVSVIRQLFLEAFERGLIAANPASRLRGYRVSSESKSQGLTRQEARDLLAAIDTRTLLGLRDRAMLSLMLRTGIRRMDVISATIGALTQHQGHKVLRVLGKGAKERTVKIPVDCWRDIEAWLEASPAVRLHHPATPLFVGLRRVRVAPRRDPEKPPLYNVIGDGQKPLAEKAVWKVVERYVRAAGIEGNITPHSTRHTFITLALDGGAALHKVQVAAGHADPRTTERYWRTKENLDDNAVDYVKL
jgi:integrase/recombinase XerD